MRAPNAVDFWRGFALVTIFVNHVPGIFFERYTFREYSLSDSAELFVFLAGVSLRFVVNSLADEPMSALVYRLAGRALTIYFAQTRHHRLRHRHHRRRGQGARPALYPAMAQCVRRVRRSGRRPYRPGAAALPARLFQHPAALCRADGDGADHRRSSTGWRRALLLPLSFALYLYTRGDRPQPADLAGRGQVVLQPLRLAVHLHSRLRAERAAGLFELFAAHQDHPVLAGGTADDHRRHHRAGRLHARPGRAADPKLFFVFDKTYLSPARVVHALALCCFFMGASNISTARRRCWPIIWRCSGAIR